MLILLNKLGQYLGPPIKTVYNSYEIWMQLSPQLYYTGLVIV